MKLAEALILRADLKKRIEQLRVRLSANAKVQEHDTPAEDPQELLSELDRSVSEFETLIVKINKTNLAKSSGGVPLVELIAKKDALTLKVGIIRQFLQLASQKVEMYSNSEIKVLSTVDVVALQKQIDELSKAIRETDTALQRANWEVELIG